MIAPRPSKTHIGNHRLHPETLMLSYGFDPQLSEGAVKPPVFLTSTFVFRTAEEGRDFFDFVSGRKELPSGTGAGLVYSRFIIPTAKSSRIAWQSTKGPKPASCLRPACPPSPPPCLLSPVRAVNSLATTTPLSRPIATPLR